MSSMSYIPSQLELADMIPAALLPVYVDIAFDAGRCITWSTTHDQTKIEEMLRAYDSPPMWTAYLRGRETSRTKAISADTCRKLGEAALATMREIRETAEKYTPQPFDDVPAVDPEDLVDLWDEA